MTRDTVKLRPFDSVVAAVVNIEDETFLITTNTNYVPALPEMNHHNVFMCRDICYRLDNPTVWPQSKEGQETCNKPIANIGTVHRKLGSREEDDMMWWDPTLMDFIPQDGPTLTAAFGRLDPHWTQFSHLVKYLLLEYNSYIESISRDKIPSPLLLLPPVIENPLATAPDQAAEYLMDAFMSNHRSPASQEAYLHNIQIEAISKLTHLYNWYRDPFEHVLPEQDNSKVDVTMAGNNPAASISKTGKTCQTNQTVGRNKFIHISNRVVTTEPARVARCAGREGNLVETTYKPYALVLALSLSIPHSERLRYSAFRAFSDI
ncbi:hypothetical protein DFH08DRAFT_813703 [Mycena albidolilacea]|uniref:Uncharacterized protein n=1 Tax=Mycena albidolilacea TaxID=1033008 RepID=A0AAD6ZQJ5_9AGAR|nr:hypothetical protein DFH08DRAFT_813703 [Mycena albidolilacea]